MGTCIKSAHEYVFVPSSENGNNISIIAHTAHMSILQAYLIYRMILMGMLSSLKTECPGGL